jgi:hypothetical protein
LVVAAFGLVAWPFRRPVRRVELIMLGLVAALTWLAATHPSHPFWPLALLIPVLALLPRPGRPPLGPTLGYVAVALGTVLVTHAVFFGEDRYHIVVSPLLCLLAACALRPSAGRAAA